MFTINIRNIVTAGKGEMKWTKDSPGASAEVQNRDVYAELIKVKPENRKALLESLSIEQLKIIQDRINALKGGTHANLVWRGQVSTEINRIKEERAKQVLAVVPAAPIALAPAGVVASAPQLVATQQTENATLVTQQAEKVTAIKEEVPEETSELRGSVGLTAQSEALQKILSDISKEKGNEGLIDIIKDLKGVNIVSMLLVLKNNPNLNASMSYDAWKKVGYTSDGEFGGWELDAINDFLKVVAKNPKLKEKVQLIASYAEAGLDPTVALRGMKQLEKLDANNVSTVIEYFGDVPSGRYPKKIIIESLNELKTQPNFSMNLARVANLSGVSDMATLVTAIKNDPTAKTRFFDNINASAATGVVGLKAFINGKGVERVESVSKALDDAAKKAVADLDAVINDSKSTPEEKENAKAAKIALDQKGGSSWLTGEIQKVAQAAFVNIGKDANAIGFGVTYEAFVRGLTVSVGAGIGEGGKIVPAAVLRYGKDAKLGETNNDTIRGNLGIGTSVFPVVIPFIDGGVSFTDKIKTIGNGVGDVKTLGVQAQWMKVGGVLMLSRTTEVADEITQGEAKLMSAVTSMAELKFGDISKEKIGEVLQKTGLTSTPQYLEYWTKRVQELYRVNGVSDTTSVSAKTILLSGLIQSEVEKNHVQQAQNDKDSRSFKGGVVGVGHIFGITFPIGGLLFKEGNMKYNPAKAITTNETRTDIKFSELYDVGNDGKTWTFKSGEKPNKVNIDPKIGTYNPDTGVITFVDSKGVKVSDITITKESKVDTVTFSKDRAQASAENLRKYEFPQPLQGGIYEMNREPKYVSFNAAIGLISDGKYSEALQLLNSKKSDSRIISGILTELNKDGQLNSNPDRLAAVLSYTYGAKDVKNKDADITTGEYKNAHSQAVQKAETRLAPDRWNAANESQFSQISKHTKKPLSELIAGQDLSVSVFATPLGGKHRIDKFQGSISVSSEIIKNVSDAQKDALIKEHASRISTLVTELQASLKATGKDSSLITVDSYNQMLKSGEIPSSWSATGLQFDKKPVFFEARAMAAGNICMNKTEGIGYPTFQSLVDDKGKTHIITRVTQAKELDYVGGSASYSEVTSGVFGSAMKGDKRPDVENREFRTEIQPRDVQVSPTNIQVIDGKQVIVISSGGTQPTPIPLSSLTRAQAMQLAQGQSITINVQVPVQVPVNVVTPGAVINRSSDAVAVLGNFSAIYAQGIVQQKLNDASFKFADDATQK